MKVHASAASHRRIDASPFARRASLYRLQVRERFASTGLSTGGRQRGPAGRNRPYTSAVEPSPIIAPSILAADFARLADEVRAIEGSADWVHVDVMDNHFVPTLTIGLPVVQSLRKTTSIPFDVHLMITDPERWAPGYAEAGAYNVTFHAEACDNPVALAKTLRAAGAKAGLAIDRDTPVEPYLELLPFVDTVLIMTIKAGFGGQAFLPEMLDKVHDVRRRISAKDLS